MHYKCYVLLPISEAKTSRKARQRVMDELSEDPSFEGDEEMGRFFAPICDWFVIGGRWSGILCPKAVHDEFHEQVKQLQEPDERPNGVSESFVQAHREQLDSIWKKLGQKYNSPLTRDQYQELGEEDDACQLEGWLAKELNVYLRETDRYVRDIRSINHGGWGLTPIVISFDDLLLYDLKDFNEVVGKYWVVIIDYHK